MRRRGRTGANRPIYTVALMELPSSPSSGAEESMALINNSHGLRREP